MSDRLEIPGKLKPLLPETYSLLSGSDLVVHEKVTTVVLHGSRGPKGGARPDSDLDLSLVTDTTGVPENELEGLLSEVARTTLESWRGSIGIDLAVVFDTGGCGLRCFYKSKWDEKLCEKGTDCFGMYKIQKGFNGIVVDASIHVEKMYPCLVIWRRGR